jgi:uncharacterized membrane protein (UPF0127 family)
VVPPRSVGVRVVHEAEAPRTLADHVKVAGSVVARARGLTFRRSVPDSYAMVFPFRHADTRRLHMVFVPFPLDAVWTVDGEVTAVERLSAWTGYGAARADRVYELPAGGADGVAVGDRVWTVEEETRATGERLE